MSLEGLTLLVEQAEGLETEQAEQKERSEPDYQSADDRRAECEQRAQWILGTYEAALSFVKPEATRLVMTDKVCEEGVKRIADVMEKYPDSKPPPWLAYVLELKNKYMLEALLLVWIGKTTLTIKKVQDQVDEDKKAGEAAAAAVVEAVKDGE